MRHSAPDTILLALAVLLSTTPVVVRSGPGRQQSLPIGTGARFLPSAASFYLALDSLSPQWEYVNRLAAFYLGSQEVEAAQRQLGGSTGMSPQELVDGIRSWVGGELFLAVPDAEELRRLQDFGGTDDSSACGVPGILFGAAIGDVSAFREFVQKVDARLGTSRASAAQADPSQAEIYEVGRTAAGPLLYVAVHDGFALVGTSRQLLTDALNRDPADSLAALPAFGEALRRMAGDSLVFLFAQLDADVLGFGGAGLYQEYPANWFAGALRLGADSVRVDVTTDVATESLGPAARALLAKRPNPVRSEGIVPAESSVFVSWDNVKLIWDAIVESVWPDRAGYEQFRRESVESIGLDPEDDVVGWMTGELALVVAPVQQEDGLLGRTGLGIVLEAHDPPLVREKLDKIIATVTRLASPDMQPTSQEIAGLAFYRIPVYEETAIYVGLAGDWVVLASTAGLAADLAAGARGAGGLHGSREYATVITALSDPVQFLGFVDVPQLVAITTTAVGAAGGDVEEVEASLRPIRGVGLAVNTTAERTDATLFAHVLVPDEPLAVPAKERSDLPRVPAIVDASRHGGAWWGPEEDPAAGPRFGAPQIPERGRAFVRFLKDVVGVSVNQVVAPGQGVGFEGTSRFGPPRATVSLRGQQLVVRVGSDGAYTEAEIVAYRQYVRCGGALLLLGDGKGPDEDDELAAAFGMEVAGTVGGDAVVDRYAATLAGDLPPLSVAGGNGLLSWDEYTEPVGFLSNGSYLDLDRDGQRGLGEPAGAPVVAVVRYGWGRVAFLGTTALLDEPEHPLTTALLRYLVPQAPWPEAITPDDYEPDDSPLTASPLSLDRTVQVHSLHNSADHDWVYFELREGERVRITTHGSCDTVLSLYASDGRNALADDDDSGADRNAMVVHQATEGGTYYAEVTPFGETCVSYGLSALVE